MVTQLIPVVTAALLPLTPENTLPVFWLDGSDSPAVADLSRVAAVDNGGWVEGSLEAERADDGTITATVNITSPVHCTFQMVWPMDAVKILAGVKAGRMGFTTALRDQPLDRGEIWVLDVAPALFDSLNDIGGAGNGII